MPRGTPSSARLTLSRASPQPLPEHHGRDDEADRGIDPQPSRQHDDQGRDHHAERDAGIGRHVQIGAADIEVAVAAAHEQQRRAAIDDDAERCDRHDGPAGDRRRLLQAVDRLDDDAADRDQQQPGIEQRRQDRGPPVAIGVPLRRLLLRQPRRAPCQQQRDHVGEIVNGVRNQRQRVGGIAEDQFGDDEAGIERGADGKRPAETVRRMAVAGMIMGMIMPWEWS